MRITPSKEEVTGTIFGLTRGAFWLLVMIGTMGAIGTGYWMVKPYWLGLERQAYTASHQYVEARKTALLDLASEVEKINTAIARTVVGNRGQLKRALAGQRTALVDRMKTEAAKIPADAVPARVYRIINGR